MYFFNTYFVLHSYSDQSCSVRPRDLDIPEIFQRFYASATAPQMKQWCHDFLSGKVSARLFPPNPAFFDSSGSFLAESFFMEHSGIWKCEGMANSGDLFTVYGTFENRHGKSCRFAHIWWLSGKRVCSFEEIASPL
jgi:hypothetical protein